MYKTTKILLISIILAISVLSCEKPIAKIYIEKNSNKAVLDKIVEVDLAQSKILGENFILRLNGKELPYQITYDKKLIFPLDFKGKESKEVLVYKGIAKKVDSLCYGEYRKDRADDFIWENNKSGYRIFGPALSKENIYGYDIFTKNVPYKVMKDRFDAAIYDSAHPSLHVDHGKGMDVYGVGSTLGCGASFLVYNNREYFFNGWREFKILDNGPLRFTAEFYMQPINVEGQEIIEKRTISLDAGSFLNKVKLEYLAQAMPQGEKKLISGQGIVIHKENPKAYVIDVENKLLLSSDLGDRNQGENGEIYCAVVLNEKAENLQYKAFERERAGAIAHIQAYTLVDLNSPLVYYFGSNWSKAQVKSFADWEHLIRTKAEDLKEALKIKIVE